tara:strand:- start:178 stop:588 length:411 start_codon:yes stop_codon:yes gene_type:complete
MRNFRDLYEDSVEEKQSPSQMMQQRRKMARRMKLLARKSSTKIKKKRARIKRRDPDALQAIAKRQAKQMVIKRSLGPAINYKELPIQKRIQIDQQIVAKKRKVIDKISKKILRQLKAGEGERIKKNKMAAADAVGD